MRDADFHIISQSIFDLPVQALLMIQVHPFRSMTEEKQKHPQHPNSLLETGPLVHRDRCPFSFLSLCQITLYSERI